MRIAFDVGGVLSKYPNVFWPLLELIHKRGAEYGVDCWIISDMHPVEKVIDMLQLNGVPFLMSQVRSADYQKHGENCKAALCRELDIDILIDDFPGYLANIGNPLVRLLLMPDPNRPYYATAECEGEPHWHTDGSEGAFGRRNPPGSKKPPEDRPGVQN